MLEFVPVLIKRESVSPDGLGKELELFVYGLRMKLCQESLCFICGLNEKRPSLSLLNFFPHLVENPTKTAYGVFIKKMENCRQLSLEDDVSFLKSSSQRALVAGWIHKMVFGSKSEAVKFCDLHKLDAIPVRRCGEWRLLATEVVNNLLTEPLTKEAEVKAQTEVYLRNVAEIVNTGSDVKDCIIAVKRLPSNGLVVFAARHDGKTFSHEQLPEPPDGIEEGVWQIMATVDGDYVIN